MPSEKTKSTAPLFISFKTGRAVRGFKFASDPTPAFVAAIRRALPGFEPTAEWWGRLGMTINLRASKPMEEVRWMESDEVTIFLDLFFPAPIKKPATRPGVEKDPDALLLALIKKVAKTKYGNDLQEAEAELRPLGPKALAGMISGVLKETISEKSIRRTGKSKIYARWRPFRRGRGGGGRAGARSRTDTAADHAVAEGNLSCRSRIDGATKRGAVPAGDPHLAQQERQAEAAGTRMIEQLAGAECKCGDPATRFFGNLPKCDECYEELMAEAAAKSTPCLSAAK
jgi:hypothetical protein